MEGATPFPGWRKSPGNEVVERAINSAAQRFFTCSLVNEILQTLKELLTELLSYPSIISRKRNILTDTNNIDKPLPKFNTKYQVVGVKECVNWNTAPQNTQPAKDFAYRRVT